MFTEGVKRAQEHYGSRKHYARFEGTGTEPATLGGAEIDFIESRDGFYMATVNEGSHPYIQFRGGPRGFLKVLDEKTLGYADFRGNLQYISVGNLSDNDRAALFLMDYASKRRLKILARIEVKDTADAPDLVEKLRIPDYKAKIERTMILNVEAFDWNCPQHITPRYTMNEIKLMMAPLHEQIEKLKAEILEAKTDILKELV